MTSRIGRRSSVTTGVGALLAALLVASMVGAPVAAAGATNAGSPSAGPVSGSAAAPVSGSVADPVSGSADGSSVAGTADDSGTITSLSATNVTDANDNGAYANFDVRVRADTTLPAGNDDDGEGDPRLKVLVDGDVVHEHIELPVTESLDGTVSIPASALPERDDPSLPVTVVLWEDDPIENDVLDRRTLTVPYEATEESLALTASRTRTVAGSPVYLRVEGTVGSADWRVTDAPADASYDLPTHAGSTRAFRAETPGTYTVAATVDGTTLTRTVEVGGRSALLDRYAPVFHYPRDERYRPTRFEALVEHATLYDEDLLADDRLVAEPSMVDLSRDYGSAEPILSLDGTESDYPAYDDAYRPTVYGSVHRNATLHGESYTAVTYWLFYVYDPKTEGLPELAAHQSDLESVTVFVNASGPQYVAASQHYGGELREWEAAPTTDGRLDVYPALGAHSNYLTDTTDYGGDGLLGQSQYVGTSYGFDRTADVLSVYQDTTGDARTLSPAGTGGDAYDLVPLTGEEVWAGFDGSFAGETDEGEVPMNRRRWREPGAWAAHETLSDEVQRDATLSDPVVERDGRAVTVDATLANVGPKPDTFHLYVAAKRTADTWNGSSVRVLGSSQFALGTDRQRRASVVVSAPEAAGEWDLRLLAAPARPAVLDGEDVVVATSADRSVRVTEPATPTATATATSTPTPTRTPTATPTARPTPTSPPDGGGSTDGGGLPGFGVPAALAGLAAGGALARRRLDG